jgi:NAD(P)-dependent dehydrogenase (short-subunit alcohol dehydrogenase family)
MEVNVFGVIHGCQVFLPLLRQQEQGHIVNTASVAAFEVGVPTMAPYSASKCAVLGLSESLAFELRAAGARVGVSLLAPGSVRTRIIDAERNRPADVPLSGPDPVRRGVLDGLGGLMRSEGMEPSEVADQVVQAVREKRFYVLTHPDVALTGVRKRQQWMESAIVPDPLTWSGS